MAGKKLENEGIDLKTKLERANKLLQKKNPEPDKVIRLLRPLVRRKRPHWAAFHLTGLALIKKADFQKAAGYLEKAVEAGSKDPGTWLYLSHSYGHLHEYDKAERCIRRVIEKDENHFKAWMRLGTLNKNRAKLNEALKCFQKANRIDPKSADVALKIGGVYKDQGMADKALEMLDIVLKMEPDNRDAVLEKSRIFQSRNQLEEAEGCLKELVERNRNDYGASIGLAELFRKRGEYDDTLVLYEQILDQKPDLSEVRSNYANCLKDLGLFDRAEKNYLQASKDKPGLLEPVSNYLMTLHYNPARTRDEIFEAHKMWDRQFAPETPPERPAPANLDPDRPLRIGFVSGGFRRHPVGWMITSGLENLPAGQFDLCFYTTNNKIDRITRRLHQLSACWRPVTGFSDKVVAETIRKDQVDILVDLSGHAADNRLRTIALEPAPVIVKWVGGLFNTTGLKSVDYLITDHHESPEGEEEFYTEKLVRMPDDYICFLPPDYAPEVQPLPAAESGNITFGCFNNPSKINSGILEMWGEILKRLPESRLFLKSKQYEVERLRDRIIADMARCGVHAERLIFEGQSNHKKLLESYHRVDVALDPWPYSGGLTTCEALWMGVPVVTCPGPTFAGRHSTTHLMNAGFPEWIAPDREEYIRKAVSLASDRSRLAEIRSGLREQIASSPLVDGRRFGVHLSKAFRQIWRQRIDGYRTGDDGQTDHSREWRNHITVE